MQTQRILSPAGWIFVLAMVVRTVVFLRFVESVHFAPELGDMRFYADWARRVAAGEWSDGQAFYGLPGYPFFLGGVFALVGFSPFLAGALQLLVEAGTAVLLFCLGRRIAPGRAGEWAGALAAAGWVLYQPAQAFSVVLMPTAFLVFAYWGVVLWSLRAAESAWASLWRPWLVMGGLLGFGAMWVATLLCAVPLPAVAAWLRLRWRGCGVAWACLLVGVALGSAPCWVYNRVVAGEPVFLSAHGGLNFWVGNHPGANGYLEMPPGLRASQSGMLADSLLLPSQVEGRELTRAEVSAWWSAKARQYIRENPGAWLRLLGLKVRNFWNAFEYDDLSLLTPLREEGILTPGLGWGFVATLAIPGAVLALRRYPRAWWVAGAVLLHLAVLLPVFVNERYRLAAAPGLLLLGALGLATFVARPSVRAAGVWLGVGAAGACLVWWPVREPSLSALAAYNTGVKALALGQYELAQARLEAAHRLAPENREVLFALGNATLARRDFLAARGHYATVLEAEPSHSGALNNLGLLALADHAWPAARTLFTRALEADPQNPKTHFLLAQAEYGAGDLPAARRALARALALRPNEEEYRAFGQAMEAGRPWQALP